MDNLAGRCIAELAVECYVTVKGKALKDIALLYKQAVAACRDKETHAMFPHRAQSAFGAFGDGMRLKADKCAVNVKKNCFNQIIYSPFK